MSDRQLAALLTMIVERLDEAMERTIEELPESCKERRTDYFGRDYDCYPVLGEIKGVRDSIDQIATDLKGG